MSFLTSDIRILLISISFTIHLLFLNRDVLLQYTSTRYEISLASATAVTSIRSGLVFIVCVFILPVVSRNYHRRFASQPLADLALARISAVLLALGFLSVAVAPNLPWLVAGFVLTSLGWGLHAFLRSLVARFVEVHHLARLNSFIGLFDTVGITLGGPILAKLFSKGLELGGFWLGLPFLACAGVVTTLALVLVFIRV